MRRMRSPAQFRDPSLRTDGSVVGFYEREFYVLSNFSSFQVEWRGRLWPTSEHAYQATKFLDTAPDLADRIADCRSAHDAFHTARALAANVRPDWDDMKVGLMEGICRAKLEQHPYVRRKLEQTGDLEIVEDSPYDGFWGVGADGQGRNELGRIWMRLRQEMRHGV